MDARVSESDTVLLTPTQNGVAPAPVPALLAEPGGGPRTPAPSGPFARLRAFGQGSVWTPVALKATSIALGMLGLAAIGAWSTLAGAGTPVPLPARPNALPAMTALPASVKGTANPAATAAPSSLPEGTAPGEPAAAAATAPDGKIILNTATLDDLTKLPRVGPKRAQAILDLRKRIGKFRQATDLLRVRGIGRKTLRLLLPLVTVDAPAAPKTG